MLTCDVLINYTLCDSFLRFHRTAKNCTLIGRRNSNFYAFLWNPTDLRLKKFNTFPLFFIISPFLLIFKPLQVPKIPIPKIVLLKCAFLTAVWALKFFKFYFPFYPVGLLFLRILILLIAQFTVQKHVWNKIP